MRLNEIRHTQKGTKVHNVNMIELKQISFRKNWKVWATKWKMIIQCCSRLFYLCYYCLTSSYPITWYVCVLSGVQLFETIWTVACQILLFMGFPRQEYWNGLQFPSPEDILNPGIEPTSSAYPSLAGGFFTTEPPGKPYYMAFLFIYFFSSSKHYLSTSPSLDKHYCHPPSCLSKKEELAFILSFSLHPTSSPPLL